jgi:glycerophosphoryl diester phosphodiesterase
VTNSDFEKAVALDGDYDLLFEGDKEGFAEWAKPLIDAGVKYLAPPIHKLVTVKEGKIVPSDFAKFAAEHFYLITWTLERLGPLSSPPGFYYHTITDVIDRDGDMMELLHVLVMEVEVVGVFSDWPATTTFYANCMI